jgi:NodT family efflux transporter outer membrane factor (OMF) lipoprotein
MSGRRILAAALASAALAACTTVGPNYAVPRTAAVNAPAARGSFLGAASPAISQAPVPDDWWRLYDDATLDALIAKALAANTDIRVAAANLARAEATVGEARDVGGFHGQASATVQRSQESGEQYLVFEQLPVETLADVGLRVSYQIDLFGQLKRGVEAANADAEAVQAALDVARVTVAADVAGAYLDACSAGEELKVAQHAVTVQEAELAAIQKLIAAGRLGAADATRQRAMLDQSRAALPSFAARRRADLFRLAALTGEPPANLPADVETCAAPPHLSAPIPVGDGGASLLARRPDVRQAERTLAASSARIGVAIGALYPTITIGAGTGSTGLLGDIGTPAANRWAIGPMVSWNFPSAGARARVRETGAAADAALAHFDGVVLNALRETETNLSTYARELDRNASLRAASAEAETALDENRRLREAGRSSSLSGLDAQRTQAQAQAALAASDAQVAADQVKLFLSLGGGWRQAPQAIAVAMPRR